MALPYKNRCAAGVTIVANEFLDLHMAKASGEYIKVYLYLLRHGEEDVAVGDVAAALGHTEADVKRALAYWAREGVLEAVEQDGGREPLAREQGLGREPLAREQIGSREPQGRTEDLSARDRDRGQGLPARDQDRVWESGGKASAGAGRDSAAVSASVEEPHTCPAELMGTLSQDEDFTQLLYIAQKYLNKVFTSRDCEIFGYLYGKLQMNVDLLEYLVEHCAQAGHTSIRYIETVALDWHKRGIRTAEEARESSVNFQKDTFAVMRAFGLGGRRPGDVEQKMIERWFKVYGFTRELVTEACGRTLAAIHEPSFQYADKILSQWKEAGVTGLEDVKQLDEKRAGKARAREEKRPARTKTTNRFHNYEQDSYDYDEMVWKMIREQQ